MKFKVTRDCDYVSGHLRYGHLEGIIEAASLEEAKKMIDDDDLELVVDDYEVDDYESSGSYKFKQID